MKWYFWTICIFCCFNGYSQNLVPNPSFEERSNCPDKSSQIVYVSNWYDVAVSSVDYYHRCAKNGSDVGIPLNIYGYQFPKTDSAYTGLISYVTSVNNMREYVGVELLDILEANTDYKVTLYVSLANTSQYAISNFGVHFSDTLPTNLCAINNSVLYCLTPQLKNPDNNFLDDTLGWQELSWVYTANGNEKYMTIGNFDLDSNIDSYLFNNSALYSAAYYYIDDVSIVPFPADRDINVDTLTYNSVCYSDSSVLNLKIQNKSDTVLDFTQDSVTFFTKVEVGGQIVQTLETKVTDNSNNPVPGQALAIDSFMTIDLSFIDLSRIGVKHTITTTLQFDDDVNSQNDTTFLEITPYMSIGDVSVSPNIICPGEDVNLQAQNFVGEGKWEYSEDGMNWQLLSNNNMLTVNPTDSIYYRFNICDELFSAAFLVDVVKEFRGELSVSPLKVCKGEEVVLDANNTIFPPRWQFKEKGKSWGYLQSGMSISHSPEDSIYYRVEVCGSIYSDSILVEVVNVPVTNSFSDTVCKNLMSTIEPVVGPDVEKILWFQHLSEAVPFHIGSSYTGFFDSSTVFYVQAQKAGCLSEGKAKMEIIVENCLLQIPNVFTPNGDGINDTFFFHNAEDKKLQTQIFNRWGDKVASFEGNLGWDGDGLPTGIYYFIVREIFNGTLQKSHKGQLTIIR